MTRKKKAVVAVLTIFFLYIVSYTILSAYGGYCYSQSGELRYFGGLSMSDIVLWQPYQCWYQRSFRNISGNYASRGNELGYFYSPLIILDRMLIHPTQQILDPNDFKNEEPEQEPASSQAALCFDEMAASIKKGMSPDEVESITGIPGHPWPNCPYNEPQTVYDFDGACLYVFFHKNEDGKTTAQKTILKKDGFSIKEREKVRAKGWAEYIERRRQIMEENK